MSVLWLVAALESPSKYFKLLGCQLELPGYLDSLAVHLSFLAVYLNPLSVYLDSGNGPVC